MPRASLNGDSPREKSAGARATSRYPQLGAPRAPVSRPVPQTWWPPVRSNGRRPVTAPADAVHGERRRHGAPRCRGRRRHRQPQARALAVHVRIVLPRRHVIRSPCAIEHRLISAMTMNGRNACRTMGGERTVKRLRLSRALTVPESTTVLEVCRRMAARRADAALLTDSNALLCGILTDKVSPFSSSLVFLANFLCNQPSTNGRNKIKCAMASHALGHCNEGDRTGAQDRRHAGVEGDDEAPDLRPLGHARRRGAAEDGAGQVQAPAGGG